jgi:DNA-binding transcriptional regulator YhcF (GntR family)
VANQLGVSWNTAEKALQDLHGRGVIARRELGSRLTWWWDEEIPI